LILVCIFVMCCFSNIFADISGPKTEKESSRKHGGREPERGFWYRQKWQSRS